MKQQTKQFERQFIRARNAIERKGVSMAKKAIASQYAAFIERTKTTDFRQWLQIIDSSVSDRPINQFFEQYYPMSAKLAVMVRKNMLKGKASEEDKIMENAFSFKLTKIVRDEAGRKITSITNTTKERIESVVRAVLYEADTEGWGVPEITSNLYRELKNNLVGNGYARARAIAQTEIISASNQASQFAADSTGYEYRKFWSTSGLPNIRATHLEAEQFSENKDGLRPDEPFPNGLQYPGDPNGTAEEVINCYTGDLEIKSAIVSAQRFFYSGDMVKIITVGGEVITVTPNHYILTENGFIPAANLNKGDNLLCNHENIKSVNSKFSIANNINNKKTTISQLFDSLLAKFGSERRSIISLDFDGDGTRGNGNIDIVNINRKLFFNSIKITFKNIGNFFFKQTDSQRVLIERFCRLNFGFNGMFRTSNFVMRFFNLFRSLFISHFTPFKFFGIGLTAKHYSMFTEMPIERNAWNSTQIRQLVKTHTGLIHLDKVAKVEIFKFNGHVYDFTSLTGTNIVNNIYTSNCRCTIMHEIV